MPMIDVFSCGRSGVSPSGDEVGGMSEKIRILLVEDHHVVRRYLVEALEGAGYSVQAVEGLDGMVEALEVATPHLAVVDFRFPRAPGLSTEGLGFEAQDILAEVGVPVLGMSTMRRPERPRPTGPEGFGDSFISKGFSIREFLDAVSRMLEEKGVGGGG